MHRLGYPLVAGLDEAGRGALAGPVVAAAVILPSSPRAPWLDQVRDSKQLTPPQREQLFPRIQEIALSVGVGQSGHDVIDAQGIVPATRLAMKAAVEHLTPAAQYLLIDYLQLPEIPLPQKGITYGDSLCLSIACASIVAKVTRDHLMADLDRLHPGYAFAGHKGYGTREHLVRLEELGPCPVHRRSFSPVSEIVAGGER